MTRWMSSRYSVHEPFGMSIFSGRARRKPFRCVTACCLALLYLASFPSAADSLQDHVDADVAGESQGGYTNFAIPPQSLVTALSAYSEATGLAVLADGALMAGRSSPGVQGIFTAPEALRQLLRGTGLMAHYTSAGAFTVLPAGKAAVAAADAPPVLTRRHVSLIQERLEQTLCRSPATHPGTYRLALQIWIGVAGRVTRLRLLGSTGSHRRDAAVTSLISGMAFDTGAGALPQPITILLRPDTGSRSFDCHGAQGGI